MSAREPRERETAAPEFRPGVLIGATATALVLLLVVAVTPPFAGLLALGSGFLAAAYGAGFLVALRRPGRFAWAAIAAAIGGTHLLWTLPAAMLIAMAFADNLLISLMCAATGVVYSLLLGMALRSVRAGAIVAAFGCVSCMVAVFAERHESLLGPSIWLLHAGNLVALTDAAVNDLRLRAARALGHCASCGYDLRGLSTPVCPECGVDRRARAKAS